VKRPPHPVASTLVEVLRERAERQAAKTAYRFLADGEDEAAALTFAEVDHRARAVGAYLQESGAAGERALLLYPPGLEFVVAFLGCLYGGAVAVPAYPPRTHRPDSRLAAIVADARPRFALTTPALAQLAAGFAAQAPGLRDVRWIATEELDDGWAERWSPPAAAQLAERTAFLQYTSGSTASPKGVIVTHRGLLHNERMIQLAFGQSAASVIVGWLPLYHDMGLIGNVLQPLFAGATCVLMAPVAFLQQPIRWLRAISRYRATTSGGPNFAYDLCVQKTDPAARAGLDLSSWQVAFNGAEPVRAETLDRFAAAFAPHGFRRAAFYPCYGLAEATLFVTGGSPGRGAAVRAVDAAALGRDEAEPAAAGRPARALVACGRPRLDQRLLVVDPESGRPRAAGKVGEVWVAGESVAAGYWNRPEETRETFAASCADDPEGRYLRTGDLGFLAGGELYVTGRLKDLLIVHGRNHYPQDLELTAERSHEVLRPGGGAAFAVEVDGEERVAIVHEVQRNRRRDLEGVVEAVRRAVAVEHEVPVHAVVLIQPNTLPKTSSGKVRRRACRDAFLAGGLDVLAEWRDGRPAAEAGEAGSAAPAQAPRTPTEERLAAIWREVFALPAVGVADDFLALGGDSLKATQLVSRIEQVFGVELALDAPFATPTVAGLAGLLDEMAPAAAMPANGAPPLGPLPRQGGVPLSFAQRRLWFLHQLDPGNPVHNIAAFVRLRGRLDAAALRGALDGILARHEALRTVFRGGAGEPLQEVAAAAPLALPVIDLAALPAAAGAAAEEGSAVALARLPFDLETGPFLRAALVARGEGEHGLILSWHHVAADGWSLAVFLRELTALYAARRQGRPSPLPPLPLQYADFALWQRRWLSGEALAARLAWWRRQLAGAPPALELPADRPRPTVLSHRGAHHERVLAAPLAERLAALARAAGATPFMALLAGFATLLQRAAGQDELVVGTPISGRHRRELEELIGVFINNLALRVDAGGDPTFRELLQRVRATALAAYAHQDLPFETLVDALQTERDLARTPLFQVLFVEQSAPLSPRELPDLRLEPREIDLGTARFDLALSMAAVEGGWLGTWKYSTDLFDAPTPLRLAGQLENLLAAAAAAPDLPLSRLAWLGEGERHQVLVAWNDTVVAYRGDACLHRLIEAQAARTPGAVAVACAGHELTYRDLDARAGRLAGHLRRLGVGPESLVGVAAERSLEMVVALLATLKAGGAYVPLDPDYPRERLQFMLADAGVEVLLAQAPLAAALPPHRARVVLLDAEDSWEDCGPDGRGLGGRAQPTGSAAGAHHPDHPAYAIYTSGSTGRPKGVLVTHRGIVNRLLWMQDAYGLDADDRVLQKTPFGFDVSVWEFFWPLLAGARLVVAPPGAHQDAAWLARILAEEGITTVHFVPSMLRLFLEGKDLAASCRTLRRVIASGEALPLDLMEQALALLGAPLHNLYGPTEAAIDVSFHACARGDRRRAVPIGRPIANVALHVLDRHGEPVPPGVAGELHIGGVALARGYLRRPDLTAERFVPDPWGGAGGRLYRTGDLARHGADGAIEFLGRLDHQVKVRGVRVELGEIEAALAAHPGVSAAVVTARSEGGGETRLAAYLVAGGEPAPAADELRAFLRRTLPEAMVPAAFVVLLALPLTPSGKVDRRALPAPDFARPERERPWTAPRTPLETRLAGLWQELLGIERIGVDDDFFALGGDSIQGAMFINRLQEELGEIVYVMALFDAPTVAGFAAYLERAYPAAAARLGGRGEAAAEHGERLPAAAALAALRAAVARRLGRQESVPASPVEGEDLAPNPSAVFILAPFRSGTTLLRVMLAGHPRLFAPPELELLGFRTLGERRRAYSGRNAFALEGLLRAVMELRGCDAEAARAWVAGGETADLPTGRFYRLLQEASGGRILVDKTPSYCLDLETLRRAEETFAAPRYLHLVRHPGAMIDSYVEARMDRVYDFPFPAAEQAELVWALGHGNVLEFLAAVPAGRAHRLAFEDLVREPRRTLEAVCAFLGLPFAPAMLEPYQGRRMTDGLHAESRMMGDPKFHRYRKIEAEVGERWRRSGGELRAETAALAARLGYEIVPIAASLATAPPHPAPAALGPHPVPREEGAEMPLSFSQERLWFLAQLDPASPAYNMPAAVRLQGDLDVPALARSFAEVRRRHEVLRTTFPAVHGRPAQRIAPPEPIAVPLPVVDLGALAAGPRAAERARLALAEGRRPFDLAAGPLLRTTLLRLGRREEGEHMLLVTLHHVVSDGWTIGVLVRELGALYAAFVAGRPSPLPALPVQYADYAAWQRRFLDEAAMAEHLAWWRRRLAGPLPPLALPTDRPRPAVQTLAGARLSRTLPAAAVDELRAWSARSGATLFLALLAAFDALLARYTGQDDLLLGIPIANRNRLEVEPLIGVFLNMVVQRTDAAGDPSFHALLDRVRESFLAAVPHQEVPFEKLVLDLQPERDLSRSPIFQVQFSLQNTPSAPLALPGLRLELLEDHNGTTKFDATVFLFDLPAGLTTTLEYNTDLFDAATIDRLLAHWETLLGGAVAAAGARLSELPLLAAAERAALLSGWNDEAAEFPAAPGLHRRFEAQAARRPGATAVVHDLAALTYGQLNARANRLARRLRALGVGPEMPVGLCVERSPDMVVAILGILKAGGAYVPLDPAYPPERLAWILEDALRGAAAPVVVTQERLVERLQTGGGRPLRLLCLDAERAALAALAADNGDDLPDPPGWDPEQLAYVIYTSGSTGRPKGVQVSHANVVRLFTATAPWFGFGPDDVWTLFHSYAFDFSVWEIWGALLHGGSLVVVPREVALAPAAFYELLATEEVTVLSQTPSAFRQLARVEGEEGGRRLCLRWVVFGGEALDPAALAPWIARRGDDRPALANLYGITETTVHVTWRRLLAADLARPGASPVGEPIPDLQVHLLGRFGDLLPVGVPGEIHVGGAGVARGYLGRPELTAERFVPDPFAARPGGRLYRSGDLARRRPDGDLDYLGRLDGQVKIRGFRIEPGEIEAALARHPGVGEAVVMPRATAAGDRRLVAWVVPRGAPVAAAELREHLLRGLPEYMVPAAFVPLAELPLTAHGKVDRRALPEPEAAASAPARVTPRNRAEARLAAIWRDVLRRDEVGIDDNFFELGGHSLLVTQLASRVRAAFGLELPVRAIFEAPTLAALAARLAALQPEDGAAEEAPIPRLPRGRGFLLSFAQERLWFLDQLNPGSAAYNIAVALRLGGALDLPVLQAALAEIVRRHEILRTTFARRDGEPRQEIAPALALPLPVVDLSGLAAAARGAEALHWLRAAAERPFDLARGPLLRALLVRVDAADWRALFALHHIVSDGWSNDVLVRELGVLYAAFAAGRPAPLPALPIQYADFAEWQRATLGGEALAAQMVYWRERLAGAPPLLALPTDRPRPALQRNRGDDLRRALAAARVHDLAAFCRAQGATLFMGLVAGFATLLGRYTGRSDVPVGTPVAGRNRLEVEGLIGLFVNSLVLRPDLASDPSFRAVVERTREVTLGAFAHQDLPYEKLVEELAPERNLSHAPIFQVMLALQNPAGGVYALPGLQLAEIPLAGATAKLDLTLNAQEAGGRLLLRWVYDRDLFDAPTIARLADHLERLLAAAVAAPERRVSELSLLTAAEERQLHEWNDTAAAGATPAPCLHELVAAQAARAPERPAVTSGGERLTYGELDAAAARLAARLAPLGVGPDVPVAVFAERSPAMVVALLAVLKAGGAYLPVDPDLPADRVAYLLADSGAPVVLAQDHLLARLPAHGARVVALGGAMAPPAPVPAAPAGGVGPANLAYVIYTSGSTGSPKGVMVPHRAVVNYLLWCRDAYGLGPGSVALAHSPVGFDLTVTALWGPLVSGGRVELVPDRQEVEGLAAALQASAGLALVKLTPAHLELLSRQLPPAALAGRVRTLVIGGEALFGEALEVWRRHAPGTRLINEYGPTETAVGCSVHAVGEERAAGAVPIGRPVANTRIWLLDRAFAPAPIGVPGELHVGGAQLARGYLARPDLTAERFVPDPFAAVPGARLYKTGDLARHRSDGTLDFLGRLDHQVKVRGFRIEPDEIAAVLALHPAVREAVVAARGAAADLRLVAYVAVADPPPSVHDLQGFLRDRLPAYMVPADFVVLESLPLTPAGKVDRRALPAPEAAATLEREFAPPETPTEEVLAALWEQVLGRRRVGVHDDFFALGGHSLLMPQVVSRVEDTFQVSLPLRAFFESPTIAGMAAKIDLLLLQEIEALDEAEAAELAAAAAAYPAAGASSPEPDFVAFCSGNLKPR
jgi:amino acid adenylation domain-containing protein